MLRKPVGALVVAVCLLALLVPLAAQAQGDYLDVYTVKVKPEKLADFQAVARKFAETNRQSGDRWIALESVYGEVNTYSFVSIRQSYADIDKANDAFIAAVSKAYGQGGFDKAMNDFNSCIVSARSEFRRRRWDLSRKAPQDPAAYAKLIGESRLLRTTVVHIRPGHTSEFEALLKDVKTAWEANPNTQPVLVSQTIDGGEGTTFYISSLQTNFGGFDKTPTTKEILGEEGYKRFVQVNTEAVESASSGIYRFSADLSSPPQEVAAVAPDFWQPKPVVAHAKTKPKRMAMKATVEKPKQ